MSKTGELKEWLEANLKISNYLKCMHIYPFGFRDKFTRIGIYFFIVYFLVFPMITGIEYHLYEKQSGILIDAPEQLIYGLFNIIPFWLCYKLIIQKVLFKKKYIQFILLLAVFLALLNTYFILEYWVVSKMTLLPVSITTVPASF